MRGRRGSASLVAVPGHAATVNRTTEGLCAQLASMLPGARHLDTLRVAGSGVGSVVIVDDVFTQGRITEACTRLLRDAGASEVIVAAERGHGSEGARPPG